MRQRKRRNSIVVAIEDALLFVGNVLFFVVFVTIAVSLVALIVAIAYLGKAK